MPSKADRFLEVLGPKGLMKAIDLKDLMEMSRVKLTGELISINTQINEDSEDVGSKESNANT